MSTINYIRLCESQKKEISSYRSRYEEENAQFYPRKKQDPDLARSELRLARSEYRSNQCTVCFSAKASNGSCACE